MFLYFISTLKDQSGGYQYDLIQVCKFAFSGGICCSNFITVPSIYLVFQLYPNRQVGFLDNKQAFVNTFDPEFLLGYGGIFLCRIIASTILELW